MKKLKLIITAAVLSTIMSTAAFAGEWKKDSNGWWYQNDNGSYPVNSWQEINGKKYYFNESGYILTGTTTPDGKQVDADGAMVQGPLFDNDLGDCRVTFTNYQVSTGYYGNPCIVIYFDYTNKSDKDQSAAGSTFYMDLQQNGAECFHETISSSVNIPETEDFYKHIKPGSTLRVAEVFAITDKSPIAFSFQKMHDLRNIEKISTGVLNLQ